MKLDKEDIEEATQGSLTRRDAVVGKSRIWDGAKVPYILDKSFGKIAMSRGYVLKNFESTPLLCWDG